jgi:hypothetical protein
LISISKRSRSDPLQIVDAEVLEACREEGEGCSSPWGWSESRRRLPEARTRRWPADIEGGEDGLEPLRALPSLTVSRE